MYYETIQEIRESIIFTTTDTNEVQISTNKVSSYTRMLFTATYSYCKSTCLVIVWGFSV